MFPSISLDTFSEQYMHLVLSQKAFVIKQYLPNETLTSANSELVRLEMDSKFEKGYANMMPNKEKVLSFSLSQVDKEGLPG